MFFFAGVSGDQNRTGQDTCVLMANSQSEMEEWVKSIRRVLGSASGGKGGQGALGEAVSYCLMLCSTFVRGFQSWTRKSMKLEKGAVL